MSEWRHNILSSTIFILSIALFCVPTGLASEESGHSARNSPTEASVADQARPLISKRNRLAQIKYPNIGDVGNSSIILDDGTPVLTVRARTMDRYSVLDYGASTDGVTDNSAAFYAAMAHASSAKRPLYIPAANFHFARGGPPTSCRIPIYIDGGIDFSGATPISALNDTPNNAGMTIVTDTCPDGTGLGNGLFLSMNNEATAPDGSTPGYQHNGLYINLRQLDSSLNNSTHDAVGAFLGVNMAEGLPFGRGWAENARINVPATGWSYAKIMENELHTDAPSSEPGTPTNHPGVSTECSGSYACTLALEIANAGQPWNYGLFAFDNATSFDFIQLRSFDSVGSVDFRVQHDGHVDSIGVAAIAAGRSIATSPQQRVAYLNGIDGGVLGEYVSAPNWRNGASGLSSVRLLSGGRYNEAITPKLPAPRPGGTQATIAVTGWSLASVIVGDSSNGAGLTAGAVFSLATGTCSIKPQVIWTGSAWKVSRAGACTTLPIPTPLKSAAIPVTDLYGTVPFAYLRGGSKPTSATVQIAPLWQMTGLSFTAGSGYPDGIPLDVWTGNPGNYDANGVSTTVTPAEIVVALGANPTLGAMRITGALSVGNDTFGADNKGSAQLNEIDIATSRPLPDLTVGKNGIFTSGPMVADSLESSSFHVSAGWVYSTPGTTIATSRSDSGPLGSTRLVHHFNTVTTCTVGSVSLPANAPVGSEVWVLDRCGATLQVLPDIPAHQIENGAAGAGIKLASGATEHFFRESSSLWRQLK